MDHGNSFEMKVKRIRAAIKQNVRLKSSGQPEEKSVAFYRTKALLL
jgi:hypothetical protein